MCKDLMQRMCCLQALQMFTYAQKAAAGMVIVAGLLAAAAPAAGLASVATYIGLATAAALSGVAVWQCGVNRQKFTFVDYAQPEH